MERRWTPTGWRNGVAESSSEKCQQHLFPISLADMKYYYQFFNFHQARSKHNTKTECSIAVYSNRYNSVLFKHRNLSGHRELSGQGSTGKYSKPDVTCMQTHTSWVSNTWRLLALLITRLPRNYCGKRCN